jgi:hypothetical protein
MRKQVGTAIAIAVSMLAVMTSAVGQNTVSLEDQLKAQYQLVKMGSDSSGPSVVEQGTILVIQKGGILGVPYSDMKIVPTKYANGQMHTPNSTMMKGIGSMFSKVGSKVNMEDKQGTTRLFQAGEKVYPSNIKVDTAHDKVTMGIVACDACNNVNPPTYYKSDIIFEFAKGSLAKANPSEVEDTIAQVFTIDDGNGQQQGGDQQQAQGQDQQQQGQQQQAQQAEPQTIQLGQSIDDVQNAMGKPEKIVNLGSKQIYVYKDLKITFVKGKVTDVQ